MPKPLSVASKPAPKKVCTLSSPKSGAPKVDEMESAREVTRDPFNASGSVCVYRSKRSPPSYVKALLNSIEGPKGLAVPAIVEGLVFG